MLSICMLYVPIYHKKFEIMYLVFTQKKNITSIHVHENEIIILYLIILKLA